MLRSEPLLRRVVETGRSGTRASWLGNGFPLATLRSSIRYEARVRGNDKISKSVEISVNPWFHGYCETTGVAGVLHVMAKLCEA